MTTFTLPNSSVGVAEDNLSEPLLSSGEAKRTNTSDSGVSSAGRFRIQRISTPVGSTAAIDEVVETVETPQTEIFSDVPLRTESQQDNSNLTRSTRNSPRVLVNIEYESLFDIFGHSGIWQFRNFVFCSLSGVFVAFHTLVYVLWTTASEKSCGWSNDDGDNSTLAGSSGIFDKLSNCSHSRNFTNMGNLTSITCSPTNPHERELSIDDFGMDWDLMCGNPIKISAVQTMYMIGMIIGLGLFVTMAEKFGPRRVMTIAIVSLLFAGCFTIVSNNFGCLLFFRFWLGIGSGGLYSLSFFLAMDTVSEVWRQSATSYFYIPFAIGQCLLPIAGYFVRDWKYLQALITVTAVLLLITFNLISESPRWLIRKGIIPEAERTLRKAAKVNRLQRNIPDDFLSLLYWVHEKERSIWYHGSFRQEFFKALKSIKDFPRLRFRITVLCVCWLSIGMSYYGLTVSASFFDVNVLMFLWIGGGTEVLSYLVVPHVLRVFESEQVLAALLIVGGIVLFFLQFFCNGIAIYLVFVAKFLIAAAYPIVNTFSFELMPTIIRHYSIGIFSMIAIAGGAVAPLVVEALGRLYKPLPFMLIGIFSIFAGIILIILPKTEKYPLPETMEEAETRALSPRSSFHWNGSAELPRVNHSDHRDLLLV